MPMVKVPGVEVTMNGIDWTLAPLTAGPLKQFIAKQGSMDSTNMADLIDLAVDVAFYSLKRNYPDITREQVENDLVDSANFLEVIDAVTSASKLIKKTKAAEKKSR